MAVRAWLSEGRHRIWAAVFAAVLAVALLAAAGLATWHYASFVVVPDHSPWAEAVDIEAVSPTRIELDPSEPTERPGYYGLVWQGGHAIVGPIIARNADGVTRRLDKVVPIATSEDFAAGLPNDVTFYPVPKAGHTESWNVNPRLYERRLIHFLKTEVD